jgi:hypothetical protein
VAAVVLARRGQVPNSRKGQIAFHAMSIIVAVESMVYLLISRFALHFRVFHEYNPRSAKSTIGFGAFQQEVWLLWNVISGDMPVEPIHHHSSDEEQTGMDEEGINLRVVSPAEPGSSHG